jgi:hypothetical protein
MDDLERAVSATSASRFFSSESAWLRSAKTALLLAPFSSAQRIRHLPRCLIRLAIVPLQLERARLGVSCKPSRLPLQEESEEGPEGSGPKKENADPALR